MPRDRQTEIRNKTVDTYALENEPSMKEGVKTLSITVLSITTLSIVTLTITNATLSIMTFSIKTLETVVLSVFYA
jgi:hypothetical protein